MTAKNAASSLLCLRLQWAHVAAPSSASFRGRQLAERAAQNPWRNGATFCKFDRIGVPEKLHLRLVHY